MKELSYKTQILILIWVLIALCIVGTLETADNIQQELGCITDMECEVGE